MVDEINCLQRMRRFLPSYDANYATVGLLFCINLLNYMDRFTIAGIPDMVRDFYGIDSKRLGLLQTSFILSYMSLCPVFGYFGDRWIRKWLIVIGLIIWTSTTLASSFVPSDKYGLFLTLRCFVGVGEASYSTLAPTIITDLFSGNRRTYVLGFFYFAAPVGSGFGFVLGSVVANLTHNWAWALRVTPALGVICLIFLVIFHSDPPRGFADGAVHLHVTSCGFTGTCFVLGSLSWFSVDYIQDALNARANNPDEAKKYQVALLFGLSACFAGIFGVLIGTTLAKRLRKYTPRADAYVCGAGTMASAPFVFAAIIAPYYSFYLCLSVVIPTRRASANAVQMIVTHALGDASSPFIIGAIADAQRTADPLTSAYLGMQRALFMNTFVCIFAGFLLLCASWYLQEAKGRVQFAIDASRVEEFQVTEEEVERERSDFVLPVSAADGLVDDVTPTSPPWLVYGGPHAGAGGSTAIA